MNITEVIPLLSELALKNYRENIRPDPFAVVAAYTIAAAAAAKFSPESADAAAFVAISSIIDLSRYSAQQAALAAQMREAMKNYPAKEDGARVDSKTIAPGFDALVEKLEKISFGLEANELYEATFNSSKSDNYRLALHAARAIYTHAYACSRVAYTHAIAHAARFSNEEQRNAAFKTAFTTRLSTDLLAPIDPSFFMKIMCSDAMKLFGALLLVAGIAALSLGVCGLAMAPVGAMLITAGLSGTSLTAAGGVMAATSGGLFAGRFFAVKKIQNDNDISRQEVDAMNDFEHEVISTISP